MGFRAANSSKDKCPIAVWTSTQLPAFVLQLPPDNRSLNRRRWWGRHPVMLTSERPGLFHGMVYLYQSVEILELGFHCMSVAGEPGETIISGFVIHPSYNKSRLDLARDFNRFATRKVAHDTIRFVYMSCKLMKRLIESFGQFLRYRYLPSLTPLAVTFTDQSADFKLQTEC